MPGAIDLLIGMALTDAKLGWWSVHQCPMPNISSHTPNAAKMNAAV